LFGLQVNHPQIILLKVKGEFVGYDESYFHDKKGEFYTKLTKKVKESGYRYLK
jgi:hypothetical protein